MKPGQSRFKNEAEVIFEMVVVISSFFRGFQIFFVKHLLSPMFKLKFVKDGVFLLLLKIAKFMVLSCLKFAFFTNCM